MANFKRRRPRTSPGCRGSSRGYWLRHWPRWWDVIFHGRPKRRATQALLNKVRRDELDADDVAWPLRSHRPHKYYW